MKTSKLLGENTGGWPCDLGNGKALHEIQRAKTINVTNIRAIDGEKYLQHMYLKRVSIQNI